MEIFRHYHNYGFLLSVLLLTGCAGLPSVQQLSGASSLTSPPPKPSEPKPVENSEERLLKLAESIEARGSVKTAIPVYEQAARKPDAGPRAHSKLGDAYAKLGRREYAFQAYQAAVSIDPDYGPAHYGLGGLYIARGELKEALPILTKATSLTKSAAAYDRLGVAHMLMGQPSNALASFEEAHKLENANIDFASNLALASALVGQYERAQTLTTKILKADGLQDYHRRNLITAMLIAGKPEKARAAAGNVLSSNEVNELFLRAQKIKSLPTPKEKALAMGTIRPD